MSLRRDCDENRSHGRRIFRSVGGLGPGGWPGSRGPGVPRAGASVVSGPALSPAPHQADRVHRGIGRRLDRGAARDPVDRRGRDRRADRRRQQGGPRAALRTDGRPRPVRAHAHVLPPADALAGRDERRDRSARRLLRAPPTARGRLPRSLAVRAASLARELRHLVDPALRRVRRDLPLHHHPRSARDLCAAAAPQRLARTAHDLDRGSGVDPVPPLRAQVPRRGARDPGPDRRPDDRDRGVGARYPRHQVLRARRRDVPPLRRGLHAAARRPSSSGCACTRSSSGCSD